jgi:cytochrome c oxidase subunit 2
MKCTAGLQVVLGLLLLPVSAGIAQTPELPDLVKITMTAKKYEFDPSTITVQKGQKVQIEVTALDRTHGIEIKEFGVKAKLEREKKVVVEFTADRAGEFQIKCSQFCGFGHGRMKGKLVVLDRQQ